MHTRNYAGTSTTEIQVINCDADSGTFRVEFDGSITEPIEYDATASDLEQALESLADVISDVDVTIDGAGIIPDARAVEVTEQSKRVRIEFSKVLAYQVIDESYYVSQSSNKLEELAGPVLCQQTGSDYLEHLKQISLVNDLIDDPIHHYALNLADDIIDVISTTEPSVNLI